MLEGTYFIESAHNIKSADIYEMDVPFYYQHKMSVDAANSLPWVDFKRNICPFAEVTHPAHQIEFLLTPKSPPWAFRDMNIFVGSDSRTVETIADLSEDEGQFFWNMNFLIARNLLSPDNRLIHFAIGFNPGDNLPGHHSIRKWLHSHIYIAEDRCLDQARHRITWRELSWFSRLALVEPLAVVVNDFIRKQIKGGAFDGNLLPGSEPELSEGVVSLSFPSERHITFADIQKLYRDMSHEYEKLELVYTEQLVDSETGRYIPRNQVTRRILLDQYVEDNPWLSVRSTELLYYLAENLKPAQMRTPSKTDFRNAANVWFTKGFAGAINFAFAYSEDHVRMDFIPCISTTSSMNKVLLGKQSPTIINRGAAPASDKQKKIMQEYYQEIQGILKASFISERDTVSVS